jgi:hypothetical protein
LQQLNQLWQRGQLSDTDLVLGVRNLQNWASSGLENGLFHVDPVTGRLL